MSEKYLHKYPRTPHLPWSDGVTNDDKIILADDLDSLLENRLIVTLKMDGENTSMYRDYIHARSIDSRNHESRNWVKALHAKIKYMIPEGWRICGENLYAKHSIFYKELPSYFMVFSVWDNHNDCLSYNETTAFLTGLKLTHVPVIFDGHLNCGNLIKYSESIFCNYMDKHEGYVVRNYGSFSYHSFNKNVAKYVRSNHVQTDEHWVNKPIVKNGIV